MSYYEPAFPGHNGRKPSDGSHEVKRGLTTLAVLSMSLLVLSCGTPLSKGEGVESTSKREGSARVREIEPKAGDIKVVGGVEYIYGRNRRWHSASGEPEYLWVRKDQYSPGLFESLSQASEADKRERQELEKRIEKLEAELSKREMAPQTPPSSGD